MILSFVKGNYENYLLNEIPIKNHNEKNGRILNEEERETHKWNHSRLNDSQIEYIKKLKNRDSIIIEGKKIVIEYYPMDLNK